MTPGYYWIRHKPKSVPEIARLTKHNGWEYFDGSHVKMVRNKPSEILKKVEYVEENESRRTI